MISDLDEALKRMLIKKERLDLPDANICLEKIRQV